MNFRKLIFIIVTISVVDIVFGNDVQNKEQEDTQETEKCLEQLEKVGQFNLDYSPDDALKHAINANINNRNTSDFKKTNDILILYWEHLEYFAREKIDKLDSPLEWCVKNIGTIILKNMERNGKVFLDVQTLQDWRNEGKLNIDDETFESLKKNGRTVIDIKIIKNLKKTNTNCMTKASFRSLTNNRLTVTDVQTLQDWRNEGKLNIDDETFESLKKNGRTVIDVQTLQDWRNEGKLNIDDEILNNLEKRTACNEIIKTVPQFSDAHTALNFVIFFNFEKSLSGLQPFTKYCDYIANTLAPLMHDTSAKNPRTFCEQINTGQASNSAPVAIEMQTTKLTKAKEDGTGQTSNSKRSSKKQKINTIKF